MFYELYIDRFFLENLILDYLVLLLEEWLLFGKRHLPRCFLGALAGSLGVTLMAVWHFPFGGPAALVLSALLGAAMVAVAFCPRGLYAFLKSLIWLFAGSAFLAGPVDWIIRQTGFPAAAAGMAAYTAVRFLLNRQRSRELSFRTQEQAEITLAENRISVNALVDTGNQLTEPLTGRPVSIIDRREAKLLLNGVWPREALEGLEAEEPELDKFTGEIKGLHIIPYHSIGKQAGCLIAFTADGMRIKDKQKEHAVTKPVLAISAGPVSIQGGYQLILHPMHVKEGG